MLDLLSVDVHPYGVACVFPVDFSSWRDMIAIAIIISRCGASLYKVFTGLGALRVVPLAYCCLLKDGNSSPD